MTDVSSDTVVASGSTTARTLANIAADTVHPASFGVTGNGTTNDTANLNSWLSYCAANSYAAILPPNFDCAHKGLTVPAGSNFIILGTLTLISASNTSCLTITGDNVTINLSGTIDGNASAQTVTGCAGIATGSSAISGLLINGPGTITNIKNWPINITDATNVFVRGLSMTNSGSSCEFASNAKNCWIEDCSISGIDDDSFAFYGNVTNSGIRNCTVTAGGGYGIIVLNDSGQPQPSSSITIVNNFVSGCVAGGLAVATNNSESGQHSKIILQGNILTGNCTDHNNPFDVVIQNCNEVILDGNFITGGGQSGYICYAIYIESSASYVSVINNHIWDEGVGAGNGVGIEIASPPNLQCSNNFIFSTLTPNTMSYGINGTAGTANQFLNNYIYRTVGATNNVTSASDTYIEDVTGSAKKITGSLSTTGNISSSQMVQTSTTSGGVTATGTNFATAVRLTTQYTPVTGGAGGGVVLPETYSVVYMVWNGSGGSITVYSPAGSVLETLTNGALYRSFAFNSTSYFPA